MRITEPRKHTNHTKEYQEKAIRFLWISFVVLVFFVVRPPGFHVSENDADLFIRYFFPKLDKDGLEAIGANTASDSLHTFIDLGRHPAIDAQGLFFANEIAQVSHQDALATLRLVHHVREHTLF